MYQNSKHYGQGVNRPPVVDLKKVEKSEVPIGMFVGKYDQISTLEDSRWTRDQIMAGEKGSELLVHYEEIEAGVATFMVGEKMTYLETLVPLLNQYNPIPEYIKEAERVIDIEEIIRKYNPESE
mmetsp:Transcript_11310/g.19043  ORF Transcript_11310/g.19043 Transcript_11310/m.19043 type:complete len:124 (+) Transcript_11310:1113-1484(+)